MSVLERSLVAQMGIVPAAGEFRGKQEHILGFLVRARSLPCLPSDVSLGELPVGRLHFLGPYPESGGLPRQWVRYEDAELFMDDGEGRGLNKALDALDDAVSNFPDTHLVCAIETVYVQRSAERGIEL